jgi:hypothetical protein
MGNTDFRPSIRISATPFAITFVFASNNYVVTLNT